MTTPATAPSMPSAPPALEIRDLTFRYAAHSPDILHGLSHTFTPGTCTALTGESGRGKSTLLYLMALMLTATSGSILMNGHDAARASDAQRARLRAHNIGLIFQDAQLDPHRTLMDSVAESGLYAGLVRSQARARARALLTQLGLEKQAHSRPGNVSGGQAGRAAIARALLNKPPIILADEPTGNLDRHNATAVLDTLRHAAETGCTVIIATHDPAVVNHCDAELQL